MRYRDHAAGKQGAGEQRGATFYCRRHDGARSVHGETCLPSSLISMNFAFSSFKRDPAMNNASVLPIQACLIL